MTGRSQVRHARARDDAPLVLPIVAGVAVGLVGGVLLFGALLEAIR
jgi:hypothetical protein